MKDLRPGLQRALELLEDKAKRTSGGPRLSEVRICAGIVRDALHELPVALLTPAITVLIINPDVRAALREIIDGDTSTIAITRKILEYLDGERRRCDCRHLFVEHGPKTRRCDKCKCQRSRATSSTAGRASSTP